MCGQLGRQERSEKLHSQTSSSFTKCSVTSGQQQAQQTKEGRKQRVQQHEQEADLACYLS